MNGLAESGKSKEIEIYFDEIRNLFRRYKVIRGYIFGDYVKGTFGEDSQIDLLIEIPDGMGLEFYGLWDDLEAATGRDVKLITDTIIGFKIDKAYAESIFAECVCIYDDLKQDGISDVKKMAVKGVYDNEKSSCQ